MTRRVGSRNFDLQVQPLPKKISSQRRRVYDLHLEKLYSIPCVAVGTLRTGIPVKHEHEPKYRHGHDYRNNDRLNYGYWHVYRNNDRFNYGHNY
jgi:hypothetical protein